MPVPDFGSIPFSLFLQQMAIKPVTGMICFLYLTSPEEYVWHASEGIPIKPLYTKDDLQL